MQYIFKFVVLIGKNDIFEENVKFFWQKNDIFEENIWYLLGLAFHKSLKPP